MKKKQFYPIIFLTCLTLVMIIVITPSSSIFGANTDWLSQHVNLADYIRKTMLETKSFFPDFAFNIGGGQNIYNISYYGRINWLSYSWNSNERYYNYLYDNKFSFKC